MKAQNKRARSAWWIILAVGGLWFAMGAADWYLRFAWYRWHRTIVHPPRQITGELGKAAGSHAVPAARGGDLTRLVGIPSVAQRFEQDRPAGTDYSDEFGFRNIPPVEGKYFPVVSVGDSFMAAGISVTNDFHARLAQVGGLDVYNFAYPGRGVVYGVVRFFREERFRERPPKVLIWGIVEREIGGDMFTGLIAHLNKLGAPEESKGEPAQRQPRKRTYITWRLLKSDALSESLPSSSFVAQASRRVWNYVRYFVFRRVPPDVAMSTAPIGGQPVLFYSGAIRAMKWGPHERKPQKVVHVIKFLDEYCRASGVRLVIMLIPDKPQVYRDRLPRELDQPGDPLPKSCLWEIAEGLRTNDIRVVNLLEPFREKAAEDVLLYWADDTHWNSEGIDFAARLTWEEIKDLIEP